MQVFLYVCFEHEQSESCCYGDRKAFASQAAWGQVPSTWLRLFSAALVVTYDAKKSCLTVYACEAGTTIGGTSAHTCTVARQWHAGVVLREVCL